MRDADHTRHRRSRRSLALALAALLFGAVSTTAQQAYTYTVRDAAGSYRMAGGVAPESFDFSADRDPMRVVQGAEWTWVVEEGDSLTRDDAVMILNRNVPVTPGIGDVVVRGWRPARVAAWDSFSVTFVRGTDDREVAGRTAHHYRLRAHIQRTSTMGGGQRYDYDADFWVLPDVPHGWAPFGFGTQSLPALAPRLRDTLDARLDTLGLIGRAVIHMDFAMVQDGREAGGSKQTTAFQVSDIARGDPPPSPGPAVDRAAMTALEDRVLNEPGVTCAAAADGRVPEELGDVPERAHPAILATINDGCASPELYFGMLEARIESDPEAVCGRVLEAGDATALAEAVFTETQRAAFLKFVPEGERQGFHAELRRYCEGRDGGR